MAHYRIGEEIYDGDPTTWPNSDVSALQRALGCSLGKFMARLEDMDVDAMQAFIWILRRRTEPSLRVGDVSFTVREYIESVVMTDDDVRETWPQVPEEGRAQFVASLDADQVVRLFNDGELKVEDDLPLAQPVPNDSVT